MGAADALREASGRPRYPLHQTYLDRQLEPARRALDGAARAAALAEGRALTLDQAIAEAVDWTPAAESGAEPTGAPPEAAGPSALSHQHQAGLPSAGTAAGLPGSAMKAAGDAQPAGALRVDALTYEVWRGDQPLARPLSPQEFALVAYLYAHRERVCTRRELGDAVWGPHAWDPAMLHNLVRHVKAKLEPVPGGSHYLHSVRGIGYRLTP